MPESTSYLTSVTLCHCLDTIRLDMIRFPDGDCEVPYTGRWNVPIGITRGRGFKVGG